MEAKVDHIPKIFRPFSNVLQYQFIDIMTSGAVQSNNISCSVVPPMRNFPTAFYQMIVDLRSDYLQLIARGFSHESDELLKYLHLAPLIH